MTEPYAEKVCLAAGDRQRSSFNPQSCPPPPLTAQRMKNHCIHCYCVEQLRQYDGSLSGESMEP
jgi:hypothetical protein